MAFATISGFDSSLQPTDDWTDPSAVPMNDQLLPQAQLRDGRSLPYRMARFTVFGSITIAVKLWQFFSLVVLVSIVASLPILQLASLGYLLEAAGRWARGEKLSRCLPGLVTAGYIGTAAFWIGVTAIPVFLVRDLSASAHLIAPGSSDDNAWRFASAILGVAWCVYVWWALLRGGRVYHFIWPAPVRFIKEFFRPSTWNLAIERITQASERLHLFHLWRMGLVGGLGTLMYLLLPGLMILGGLRAENDGAKALLTLFGIISMAIVLQYLPFLQLRFAKTQRFHSFLDIKSVRQGFKRAPWLHAIALVLLVVFSIPLYLLRIETPPSQAIWFLCVFFVLFNLPAKFLVAWAIRYADMRERNRAWYARWPAWLLMVASFPVYILFLYLAPLSSWDGSAVLIVQHAFLLPVPFLP